MDLIKMMLERGWECWDTGGGGTALVKQFDGGFRVVATDMDGMAVPMLGEAMMFGLYYDATNEPVGDVFDVLSITTPAQMDLVAFLVHATMGRMK